MGEVAYIRKTYSLHPEKHANLLNLIAGEGGANESELVRTALQFYFDHRDAPPMDQIEAMIDRKLSQYILAPSPQPARPVEIVENRQIQDDDLDF